MLPIRKSAARNLNMWTGSRSRKPKVLSKVPEIVRNAVKFTFIRKMRQNSRGQTGSSGELWPTFGHSSVKLSNVAR